MMLNYEEGGGCRVRRAEEEVDQRISRLKIELDEWEGRDHWALASSLHWTRKESLGR